MATKIKAGLVARGVRRIAKADHKPFVFISGKNDKCALSVTEYGDTRLIPISKKTAEVLLANGFTSGS